MEEKLRKDVEKAKEILSKIDPELALMAIAQLSVDYEKVDKIKKYLSEYDPTTVQCAIAEIQLEAKSNEMVAIKEELAKSGLSLSAVKQAAIALGFAGIGALCASPIDPCGTCIVRMVGRCKQDMVAILDHRAQVSQTSVQNSTLAHKRAIVEAEMIGEV